jgi:outer membrane protein assembly factor BamB
MMDNRTNNRLMVGLILIISILSILNLFSFFSLIGDATQNQRDKELDLECALPTRKFEPLVRLSTPSSCYTRSSTRSGGKEWPMFRNTPDRSGKSTSSIPSFVNLLWSNPGLVSYTSPVVKYGNVYMSTIDGNLHCFEETTGNLCWRVKLTSSKFATLSTPAINQGFIILFNNGDGKVFRLNAYTGELNWTYTLPGKAAKLNVSKIDQPILIYKGNVIFGAPDKYFYCLNETSGKLVWRYKTQLGLSFDYGITGGAAAISNEVYFGANDGYLYAMDFDGFLDSTNDGSWIIEPSTTKKDGDVLWKFYTGDSICSTPAVFNDYVYVTVGPCNSSLDDYKIFKIFCLNRNTGVKVWDYTTENHIVSSPAVAENKVFFGSLDGNIYCLATDTNTSQWTPLATGGEVWSSPAVSITGSTEKLVIGSTDGYLYCIYTQTGVIEWQNKFDGPITSSPALANGRIFIHTQQGKLICIGPTDNEPPTILQTYPADNDTDIPVSNLLSIRFSEPMDKISISPTNIILKNSKNEVIPINLEYDDSTSTVSVKPIQYLSLTEVYHMTVKSTLKDRAGNMLDGNKNGNPDGSPVDDIQWRFTTSNNNPPELINAIVTPATGSLSTEFEFRVLYHDKDNDPPQSQAGLKLEIYFDSETKRSFMTRDNDLGIPDIWRDGNYINGEQFKLTNKKFKEEGLHGFRIWCSDGKDWNETIVSNAPIIPGAPVLKNIPDQYVIEDQEHILNLTTFLTDPDTPLDNLILKSNSSYSTVHGLEISFIYPNSFNYPSARNFEIVNISISDGEFFTWKELTLWVQSENDAPIIKPIPNQIVIEKRMIRLNLSEYIHDDDNLTSELIITEDSNEATMDGMEIIFFYPLGGLNEEVTLNVSDGLLWMKRTFNVKVVSSEVSFVLREIEDLKVIEDIEYKLNLTEYIIIIKGSIENLKLSTNSGFARAEGNFINFLYPDYFTYVLKRNTETVEITVTDSVINFTQSTTVKVDITAMNDAPNLNNGSVDPEYGNITSEFIFKVYYYDVDGSENTNVYIMVDGIKYDLNKHSGTKSIYPGVEYSISLPMSIGYHYYQFGCNDGTDAPNNKTTTERSKFYVSGNLGIPAGSGSKPTKPDENQIDYDSDGIPDSWELLHGLNSLNKSDALADFDGDNFNNLLEYFGNDGLPGGNDSTNPNDENDKPISEVPSSEAAVTAYEQWEIYLVGVGVVIVILVIIYSLFESRGLEKSAEISEAESRFEEPTDDEMALEVDEPDDDLEPDDEDIIELDMDSEPVFMEDGVPVTEVDLTQDERPFLESQTDEDTMLDVEDEEESIEPIEKTESDSHEPKADKKLNGTERKPIKKRPKQSKHPGKKKVKKKR